MKYIKIITSVFLSVLLFCTLSVQSQYMKIGDIKGESEAKDHKDWINISSFSMGMSKGEKQPAGRVAINKFEFEDLVVIKKIDKSSPVLMAKSATGEAIPELILELAANDGRTYYKVTLKDVIISSFTTSSNCEPHCETTEEISFNYSKISWEYNDKKGGKITAGYDVKMNKKI